MRDIIFRGKRLDNGEWVEGNLITGKWYIDEREIVAIAPLDNAFYPHCEMSEWYEVDPATVGQYTGLTANSKKIFEGDIVQFQTRGSTFKPLYVRWYEECAQFIVTERDGVRSYPMDRSWRYEILGNVCDNIELLREVDNG